MQPLAEEGWSGHYATVLSGCAPQCGANASRCCDTHLPEKLRKPPLSACPAAPDPTHEHPASQSDAVTPALSWDPHGGSGIFSHHHHHWLQSSAAPHRPSSMPNPLMTEPKGPHCKDQWRAGQENQVWKYYQSNGRAPAEVLQNLKVRCYSLHRSFPLK